MGQQFEPHQSKSMKSYILVMLAFAAFSFAAAFVDDKLDLNVVDDTDSGNGNKGKIVFQDDREIDFDRKMMIRERNKFRKHISILFFKTTNLTARCSDQAHEMIEGYYNPKIIKLKNNPCRTGKNSSFKGFSGFCFGFEIKNNRSFFNKP